MHKFVFIFIYLLHFFDCTYQSEINNRPIIGILTQEISPKTQTYYPGKKSTIAASYVKFIESAGGRVVPIWIGKTKSYYTEIMSQINGILFPGGNKLFNKTNGYAAAGEKIYSIAKELNKNGQYFPIMGICLGYELLLYLSAQKNDPRVTCNAEKQSTYLMFEHNQLISNKLTMNMPEYVYNILSTFDSTTHSHHYCITQKSFEKTNLDRYWNVLSKSYDLNGKKYISMVEHKTFPFFGLQFHPEKNMFEFIKNRKISHTSSAIQASQYFANFFVDQCRKNFNSFPSEKDEMDKLIYNYQPVYSAKKGSVFQQSYYFKQNSS